MNNLFMYISTIVAGDDMRRRFLWDKDCILIKHTELSKLYDKYGDRRYRFMKKLYGFNWMVIVNWCGTDDTIIGEWDEDKDGFRGWRDPENVHKKIEYIKKHLGYE